MEMEEDKSFDSIWKKAMERDSEEQESPPPRAAAPPARSNKNVVKYVFDSDDYSD